MQILVVFGVIVLLAGVALGLPRSFKPEVRCPQGPTAAKTQSKLWFNDGLWWGILFDLSSEEFHIYRYDLTEDTWKDTGILVDGRNTSRGPTPYGKSATSTWSVPGLRRAWTRTAPAFYVTVTIPQPTATRSMRASL
jgi:hypothetical protein